MHLQQCWSASGEFWQSQWYKIYGLFGNDEYFIVVWGTFLVTFCVYWIIGLFYTFIDLTGKPAFALRYKIQDTPPYPVSRSQVMAAISQVLFNQLLVNIPIGILFYYVMVWRGYDSGLTLPTFQRLLFELAICFVVLEPPFYYSHRLLHHGRIYKYIHKRHHEWIAPIAITAIYCHPIEHIFANLMPVLLGPLILGSHMATIWIWFSIATLGTMKNHSGFEFPFLPLAEAHDYHHFKFNQNFGVLGIMDRLHGTDSLYRNSKVNQHSD